MVVIDLVALVYNACMGCNVSLVEVDSLVRGLFIIVVIAFSVSRHNNYYKLLEIMNVAQQTAYCLVGTIKTLLICLNKW